MLSPSVRALSFLAIFCLLAGGCQSSTEPSVRDTSEALTSTITIGQTAVLDSADNGNANLLLAQQAILSQAATLQSLSFYVTTAGGTLRLGLYDASGSGGRPGALLGTTNEFTPVAGWNTASVVTPVALAAGTYWLAYAPSSNALGFRKTGTGTAGWRNFSYAALPATFGTPSSTATVNWSLYATLAVAGTTNQAPTISSAATSAVNPVTATQVALSVLGADDGGESALTYQWTASGPAAVTFSVNGSNAAKHSTATFKRAGSYALLATVTDSSGLTASSSVTVTVNATLSSIVVTPSSSSVTTLSTQQFSANAVDQFGISVSAPFTWSVSGGGSISSSGLFTAGATAGGPFTVTASSGTQSGTASVTVAASTAQTSLTIGETSVLASPDSGNGNQLIAQQASLGQIATLQSLSFYVDQASGNVTLGIYDASGPSGGPGSLVAHTNSFVATAGWNTQAVTTTPTLSAGTYWLTYLSSSDALSVRVATSGTYQARSLSYAALPTSYGSASSTGASHWSLYATLAASSSTLPATLTSIAVSPSSVNIAVGGSVQFSAAASDQNGKLLSPQPTFSWSVPAAAGAVSTSGLFSAASTAGGPFSITASSGTVSGTASVTVTATSSGSIAYPLKASANGRYLVDQNGTPVLLAGDGGGQDLMIQSIATATTYLTDRAAHNINALWCHVIVNDADGGNANGGTNDGILPFTATLSGGLYDVTKPNPAYFARLDQILNLAANNGIVVFFDALENNGFLKTFEANGNAGATSWATYLATRYKNFPNLVWLVGNDFQTWKSSTTDNALAQAMLAALQTNDPNHMRTTELDYNMSGSLDDALLVPYTSLAGTYTYYPAYFEVYEEYISTAATVPVWLEETYYDGVHYNNNPAATPLMLRKQAYWTVLAGGLAGFMSGSVYYDFHSGWQTGIDSQHFKELGIWRSTITGLSTWYNLVPDNSHVIVTTGWGTRSGNYQGDIQTDNFVTAGGTPDKSLVASYFPASTTFTIDLSKLRGAATARWIDPTTGASTTISGSPFANSGIRTWATPGNNAGGDPDWLLVLQAP